MKKKIETKYSCEICEGKVPKKMFMAIDFRDSEGIERTCMMCEICAEAFVVFMDKLKSTLKISGMRKLVSINFDLIMEK